jgi:hypothetical protein
MASSIGAQYALTNQGGLDTYYRNIQNMLNQSGGLTSAMADKYGISGADINAAQSYKPTVQYPTNTVPMTQGTPISQIANPQPANTSTLTPVFDTGNQGESANPTLTGYTSTAQDASGKNVLSTYDANGKLISNMTQSGGTQSTFDPSGKLIGTQNVGGSGGAFGVIQDLLTSDMVKTLAPMMITAGLGGATGAGNLMGLSGTTGAIAGGAALGAGTAAIQGGNILQGATLGGGLGYLQGALTNTGTGSYIDPGLSDNIDAGGGQNFAGTSGATSYPVAPQTPFSGTSILDPLTGAPVTSPTDYSLGGSNVQGMGGAQGIQVNPNANLSDMGGGQGITNATSANLADMGGAQGITTGASGGGVLGATGVNTGGSVLGINPLTGQTLGTALNTLNPGVTNPQISTTGGLPLTNNLTGGVLGAGAAGINTGIGAGLVGAGAAGAAGAGAGAGAAGAAGAGGFGTGLTPAQIIALGSGVAGLAGGINTNSAISDAQAIQNAAAAKSAGTLGDIYNTQMASLAPYQATGQAGLTGINANMPYFQHQFDANDLNTNLAPNYAFQLGQGQQANQRAANVGGGALSGNTITGLNRYTQDYAGNAYQQAFNNYNTQRNNIYNTLSGIAGLGTTANAQGISAGGTYGTNLTNLQTGLAAAQAGATVGQAQNTSNTISNLGNTAVLASLLGQRNTVPT